MTQRLAEVARRVGVSEATVSRVLNGKLGVSEPTRRAVLAALDVLGYERPTKLRGERRRLVGLVLPELQNPIFPAFAEVVGGTLAQSGYTSVLCTPASSNITESDYVDLLLEQRVSGILFMGGNYAQERAPHEHYARLKDLQLPTVLLNARSEEVDFPTVSCDDTVAMEFAVGHLYQLGHERIGLLLGPEDHVASQRKLAAAKRWAAERGITISDGDVAHSLFSLEAAQASASRLLTGGVTGIVCASDVMALGAIRAARRLGRSIPGEASVVGFDDSALMNCTDPPLTTLRQPIEPMGRMMIELLVRQMGGLPAPLDEFVFEPELVVRRSSGPRSR